MIDHALQTNLPHITQFTVANLPTADHRFGESSDFEVLPDHLQPQHYLASKRSTKNQPRRVLEALAFTIFLGAMMEIPALMADTGAQSPSISNLRLHCQLVQDSSLAAESGTVAAQRCYWASFP